MSRVLFRPHRGGLDQAMAECREFTSPVEMLNWLADYHREIFNRSARPYDYSLEYYGFDDRIKWDVFVICDAEGHPCGWCAFNEDAQKEWKHE